MATARKSSTKAKSSGTKSSGKRSSGTHSKSGSGKSTSTKSRTRSTAAHSRKTNSKKTTRASKSNTAHKTGRKTAHGQAWTDKHSDNPSSTGHGKAKKEPAKQTSQCWPGYEPVAGKARGTKGSCKPKAHQTAAEKKSDAMAASASKLRKAGGNKARAK